MTDIQVDVEDMNHEETLDLDLIRDEGCQKEEEVLFDKF
jgi:hypothetical protein